MLLKRVLVVLVPRPELRARSWAVRRLLSLSSALTLSFVVLVATPLSAYAAPPPQTGPVFHIDETFVDPILTSECGFTVIEHDVGVIRTSVSRRRFTTTLSVRSTFTNPATGNSVVVRTAGSDTFSFSFTGNSFTTTQTFTGLNFQVIGADGAVVSAGRGVATTTFTFDEEGNLIDITFEEKATPHLEHIIQNLPGIVCPVLADA